MKIYIVGTGGVGGYLGGLLAKSEKDVTFVARGDHYKAIKNKGLRIESIRDGNFHIKPAKVFSEISQIKNPDLIIFTVKTYDTDLVSRELSKVVTSKTSVITFQNGIENDKMIKKFVKKGKVYPGVAYIVSKKIESGFVRQTGGLCKFIFGDRENPSNKVLKEIEEIMKDSGIDATFSEDIESHLWKKYIFINAMTGLTALSRTKVGTVVSDPFLRKLYERCLKECVKVAKAEKVNLPYDIFNSIIKISEDTSKEAKFSMLVDIENGRKTEIEALNGTLVRLAKKHKIDVPINETIYGALRVLN
ncbi:hypothetical protein A2715_04775 [Candidatus Woesebacteria bacterium RIFCSPHIGHO2_01_FULL_39_32]|uniref:2-dehydropantoate 2-reductase n=1 Tax=Candidatus Woesebacteria bacterium RIFCSPLOWO2_01_FULL_39_25 TaxID=1802521 RepID=A0A1F8BLE5_9BACT|nr:MAG: hypothetical protein A2124_03315 [Candidatus Woesebacteria bacterium GWB1_37_5]OGM25332.1 MAG: hypothetical protein A2715_04775 [Candidatus Woesebacteria bacterium RIFCSPHIGHO2_01_FULL_39_32]OGM37831.1 MAG: hypothetical protein A3F01_01985 [Candidatus Woesebacteria bacterium RIFCSPHIGHO2_12_FULL_38_11]OGM64863.1 MAG: hypothetical protein A2893_04385 [Candidatus Woesebacteria bacterium RIFCSPLOWO2_01_FULL_39_25]